LIGQKSLSSTKKQKPKFFYGYIIVLASYFIVFISWGAQYSFGVFFKPVLNEFGWSRAAISGAYSLSMVLTGFFYIFAGRLVDKFGPRIVQTAGALFIALGYLLMSTVSSEWQYYLYYGVIISIGLGCTVVPLLSNVARWFTKGRGLATGIVMSGIGIGVVVMPQVANKLISSYSWRTSFFILGIIALVLIAGFAQFLKRAPEQAKVSTPNTLSRKGGNPNIQLQGLSTVQALRTRQFWITGVLSFVLGYIIQTLMAHIVPHATDIGNTATVAASILSAIGLISVFGKISMGSVSDRIGNRNTVIIVCILLTAAFVSLRFDDRLWVLYLAAVIFSLGYSGSSATHSPLMAEFFGLRSHGTLYGINQFIGNIGGALGPFLAGYIFDTTGSYQSAFLICVLLSTIGLVSSILLKPVRMAPTPIPSSQVGGD
jgi:MFS family permease